MKDYSHNKNIFLVIPVFNEAPVIATTVAEMKKEGYYNLILVDDGSKDETYQTIKEIPDVIALRHKFNRGKGAAVKTGLEAALTLGAEIIVTLDGDGQHDPSDIKKLTHPIEKDNFDVVLGSRLINPKGMPKSRIFLNKFGNFYTWMLYGLNVTDSQSGFRSYTRRVVEKINPQADRYDFDSEIIREIASQELRFKEVPVKVRYTPYSIRKKHGQGLKNGFKTALRILWNSIN
ncbi:MAG: glycosyltransferase family 2 protein [Patescibacteria group bacterium]|nr:glycosyltransferase family 2 protein [Patescibacteria group bacterium]